MDFDDEFCDKLRLDELLSECNRFSDGEKTGNKAHEVLLLLLSTIDKLSKLVFSLRKVFFNDVLCDECRLKEDN